MSLSQSIEQIPARMLNEFTYCPRLYYLEHVQQEWAHSADTEDVAPLSRGFHVGEDVALLKHVNV